MMTYEVCIQVHTRLNAQAIEDLGTLAQNNGLAFKAEAYDEKEDYQNLHVNAEDLSGLRVFWNELLLKVGQGGEGSSLSVMKAYWIVVLIVDGNWDNYILLAHADEGEQGQIDPFPADEMGTV